MSRQSLRMTLLIIAMLIFPVTLYYFSPYLIIVGASEGVVTGSMVVFLLMFLTAVFLGRGFCGWLCPAGGIQECLSHANSKSAKGGKFDLIKFVIWIPWILGILAAVAYAGGLKQVNFFYQTVNGISVARPEAYGIYYGVVGLIVLLALTTGRRGFCHYACWMSPFMILGSKLGEALHFLQLHLHSESQLCIGCGKCTQKCPMSLPVEKMVKTGGIKHTECILCGACVDHCPKKVIGFTLSRRD